MPGSAVGPLPPARDLPRRKWPARRERLLEERVLGSITAVCPCDYGYDARVEIVGEKGIMQIGDLKGQTIVTSTDRDQGLITPIYRTWPHRFEWAYIREIEHFVTCIQTETQPKVGGRDGRWAVAGVLAGTKSFLEERSVYMNEVL